MLQLNWRAAATVVTGATALVGWLAAPDVPARTAPSRAAARRAPVTASLEQEATRLAARVRAATGYEQPLRNPFRFPAVAPTRRTVVPAPPGETTMPAVPVEPPFPFRLTGVAQQTADGSTRTAVLSSDALGLVLAAAGETVADRFRVEAIGEDFVELVDVREDRVIHLTLGR